MREAEIEDIECPLKANNILLDIRLTFNKNPIRIYDEVVLQLQIIPVITLHIENIVIDFDKSSMNKEVQVQSELIAGIKYSYDILLYIEPTAPSTIKIKNLLIRTKFPE